MSSVLKRRTFLLAAPAVLVGCGVVTREEILAPQSAIERVAYVHPGPKRLTLLTMKNTGSDNGAHTGLMINASQRVLWDPAGTFGHATIPERNDVHFGITPQLERLYISYHSRITFYTLIQEVDVESDVAELALRRVIANGPTPKAACTTHTSRLLGTLPGFESIRRTFFPNNLSNQFEQIPGVRSREYREMDVDDKSVAAQKINTVLTNSQ